MERITHQSGMILCQACFYAELRTLRGFNEKNCKLCNKLFTFYFWCGGPGKKIQETNICFECSKKLKICECCLLSMEYWILGQGKDDAFRTHQDLPQSHDTQNLQENSPEVAGAVGRSLAANESSDDSLLEPYKKNHIFHRAATTLDTPDDETITTIHIENVNKPINKQDIRHIFKKFGKIRLVTIVPRQSCAFVQYTKRCEAELAIEETDNLFICGRHLTTKWALYQKPKPPKKVTAKKVTAKKLDQCQPDQKTIDEPVHEQTCDSLPPNATDYFNLKGLEMTVDSNVNLNQISQGITAIPGKLNSTLNPATQFNQQLPLSSVWQYSPRDFNSQQITAGMIPGSSKMNPTNDFNQRSSPRDLNTQKRTPGMINPSANIPRVNPMPYNGSNPTLTEFNKSMWTLKPDTKVYQIPPGMIPTGSSYPTVLPRLRPHNNQNPTVVQQQPNVPQTNEPINQSGCAVHQSQNPYRLGAIKKK